MDRLTLIDPSHMYVVATLPLIHQQELQAQLTPLQLQTCANEEYVQTWKRCRPNNSAADIVRYHRQGLSDGIMIDDGYDPANALEALSLSKETVREDQLPVSIIRSIKSTMLPHKLHDLWPRIFTSLTHGTFALSKQVNDAHERLRRRARVDCVHDLLLNRLRSTGEYMIRRRHHAEIARGLKGWQDLQLFMSEWILEVCSGVPPPSEFLAIARKMGLAYILPPLIKTRGGCTCFARDAGYVIAGN